MEQFRQIWTRSKWFRVVMTATIVYTVLRVVLQGVLLAVMMFPSQLGLEMPEWAAVEEAVIPPDLQIYITAATHFQQRQDLYLKGSLAHLEEHYPYAPSFAMVFTVFLLLTPPAIVIVHTLLHFLAYALLYISWRRIFWRWRLERASEMLVWTLPVWLLFSSFWTDLGYLNIYIVMALLATFSIEAVLEENLAWSVLWLSILLQIKPHWAFVMGVPLVLGRYRFFFKMMGLLLAAYVAIVGVTILAAGPEYGWQQHIDYYQFLERLSRDFPWRSPAKGFLGYNHSVAQVVVYVGGLDPAVFRLATAVKILILLPLAVLGLRYVRRPAGRPGRDVPQSGLDWAFALYMGAFIWLDMVWEVTLGVAVFTYLLATLQSRPARILVSAAFLPYALLDPWRIFSLVLAFLGVNVIAPGPYILTDPNIYVPLMMIIIVVFYGVLIRQLWKTAPGGKRLESTME